VLKRLIAIAVIFCGAALSWMILGQTLVARTSQSDSTQRERLSSLWGSTQTQVAPRVFSRVALKKDKELLVFIPIRSSRINVGLNVEQRRKGLLWYNMYDVSFAGRYVVRNDSTSPHLVVELPLPSTGGSYIDLAFRIGGRLIDNANALNADRVEFNLDPGQSTTIDVGYRSHGMDSWTYDFKADQSGATSVESVRDFAMTMTTNFDAIDFPTQSLPPTLETRSGGGSRLQWNYQSLVTSDSIGMVIPYPLQPGPLAERITFWAPIALLFYFFVMLLITTLRGIDLHPVNYFFLAAAFFAFHLLLAYLVDRIALEAAFAICSIVSMFLTVSYLRLVVGLRFAAVESAFAQFVYLVLFSYALFNEGWSGLTITIGAIVTLFVAMQLTGRIRWSERFA
jgi:inner membrane protein involved in colicin E2 resistance